MPSPQVEFKCAVEGLVDEAVIRKIMDFAGVRIGGVYVAGGKGNLRPKISGYNNQAKSCLWVVLIDLDDEEDCAPPFRESLLPRPSPYMCLRIVVHEIEAWLMADREHLSEFLKVNISRIPQEPEAIPDPKERMVELARSSRSRATREDMVPRPGSGRSIGPAYSSTLSRFVWDRESGWNPEVAMQNSDSLRRCIHCIRHKAAEFQ